MINGLPTPLPPSQCEWTVWIPRHGTLIQLQNAQHQLQVNWQQPLLPCSPCSSSTTDSCQVKWSQKCKFHLGAQREPKTSSTKKTEDEAKLAAATTCKAAPKICAIRLDRGWGWDTSVGVGMTRGWTESGGNLANYNGRDGRGERLPGSCCASWRTRVAFSLFVTREGNGARGGSNMCFTPTHIHTHTHTSSFAYVWYLGKLSLRSSVSFCILCGLPRKRKHTHTLINSNSHTQREKPLIDWAAKVAAKGQRQGQTHSGTKTKDSKCDAITLG